MTVLTILLLLFTTTTASPTSWTQGYLAEYYHQCEPGSFVDEQMKDAVFTPEIICADKETNNYLAFGDLPDTLVRKSSTVLAQLETNTIQDVPASIQIINSEINALKHLEDRMMKF